MSIRTRVEEQVKGWGAPWTAAEAFTWVAFGEARKFGDNIEFLQSEWSHDWGMWPVKWLGDALVEIATGEPFATEAGALGCRYLGLGGQWPGFDPGAVGQVPKCLLPFEDKKRARESGKDEARALIASTGKTAAELIAALNHDVERYHGNQDRLLEAQTAVVAAARDGLLKHRKARPAFSSNRPDLGADHEDVSASLLYGARTITLTGKIELQEESGFDFLDNRGRWYDEFRFDSAEVQSVAWTLKSGQSDAGPTVRSAATDKELAFRWMRQNVTTYVANQRDDRVRDCVAGAKVKKTAALEGWNALPEALKGRSRQPK